MRGRGREDRGISLKLVGAAFGAIIYIGALLIIIYGRYDAKESQYEIPKISKSKKTYSQKTKKIIDDAIANGAVVIFSATYCPFCKKTKEMLNPFNPVIIEVDQVGNMNEFKAYLSELTGALRITRPRVFIGGKSVGGCDDTTKLQKNGQLQKLTDEAKKKMGN